MKKAAKFVLLLLLLPLLLPISESGKAPAMFIFGDSLVDNGNNNFLLTLARANYVPYGIDYGYPTGRFCNGFTVTDYGAQLLGLPLPIPYLSLETLLTDDILQGVNYASAAAGILEETGKQYGARISFNGQLAFFEKTVTTQLPLLIPDPKNLSDYLSNSVFIVVFGSNDYINNYLLPDLYESSTEYTADAFADLLICNLENQLTSMYNLGAKKVVLVGVGPLGCIPSQLYQGNSIDGSCIDDVNQAVTLFNERLETLTTKLNSTLPGSFFIYEDIYDNFIQMVQNPADYGFISSNEACCGNGRYGGKITCLPLQEPCLERDEFIFWDSFHPTQAVNNLIARRCYTPTATDCRPISAFQLAQI
ncbi:hypothetical protein HPP92_019417 [Vanilla planifolia]|uniref:GDSL esterase/lipase 7 n=1 Tax=Vanilla planifolia TaxID=51239 RepID=A0A835Q5R2_VANPL|nr:hypothetical protein HPP92_019417 [Vanilla planifolia]